MAKRKSALPQPLKMEQREETALEERRWVRLNWACNNHCRFCHDSLAHTGAMRDAGEIEQDVRQGLAEGCRRLILSGGEPTLHPRFLEFVALGKQAGYRWVQVVTNGRMFAYADFADQACSAGLDEATFSIHGADAGEHDSLVGVPGAFSQSLEGMRHLQGHGIVVNMDVVLNAFNLESLPRMVEHFSDRGVTEFDVLWLVPFGRAWENRAQLFVDPARARRVLERVFALAARKSLIVWTNRLPADLLEGNEAYIQDPHKIQDELHGRRAEFETLLDTRQPLACRQPERCAQCFLKGFCDWLNMIIESLRTRKARLVIDVSQTRELPDWPRLRLECGDIDTIPASIKPRAAKAVDLVIQLPEGGVALLQEFQGIRARYSSSDGAVLEALLQNDQIPEVVLKRESRDWLAHSAGLARGSGCVFRLETYPTLSETLALGFNDFDFIAKMSIRGGFLSGIAPCLVPNASSLPSEPEIGAEALGPDFRPRIDHLAHEYVLRGYRVFSQRCAACRRKSECPGVPIHVARARGFRLCRPVGNSVAKPLQLDPSEKSPLE